MSDNLKKHTTNGNQDYGGDDARRCQDYGDEHDALATNGRRQMQKEAAYEAPATILRLQLENTELRKKVEQQQPLVTAFDAACDSTDGAIPLTHFNELDRDQDQICGADGIEKASSLEVGT